MTSSVKKLLTIALVHGCLFAQGQTAEMADGLRAEGKIYVVVLIIVIILAGLVAYLLLMDRKLNKLEKMLRDRGKPNR